MSTSYDFTDPTDLPAMLEKLKEQFGIIVHKKVKDEHGENYTYIVTDGHNFVHCYPFEWEGKQHLSCERFGGNDPHFILNAISELAGSNYVDEHDEDYFDLPWYEDED